MFIMTALFTALFLGGMTTGMLWLDVIIALVFCTVVTAREHDPCCTPSPPGFRVEQVFKFFWTVVSGLALVSLHPRVVRVRRRKDVQENS